MHQYVKVYLHNVLKSMYPVKELYLDMLMIHCQHTLYALRPYKHVHGYTTLKLLGAVKFSHLFTFQTFELMHIYI